MGTANATETALVPLTDSQLIELSIVNPIP